MDRWLEIAATAEGRGRLFRNPEFGGIIIRFASDDACIAHQLDAMDFDGHLTCSDLERDLLVSATTDDQRQDRLFARWAVCCSRWFIHPRRCLYPRGQHGGRLLHGACAERFLPTAQRRGVGNRLLFRISLFLPGRGRPVEPRSSARVRRVAEPRLSNSIISLAAGWGERAGLQTSGFFRTAIGISRKLITVNSLIQKP